MEHRQASGQSFDVAGFVLAGGRSTRMGRDKALLPWSSPPGIGQTLLTHAIEQLQAVCTSISVCGNRADLRDLLPASVPILADALSGTGPLGGIVAALDATRSDWNLVLAVDLPLVPTRFLHDLVRRVDGNDRRPRGSLCVLPRVADLPQPLCAIYHRSLAAGLRRALEQGTFKMMTAITQAAADLEAANRELPADRTAGAGDPPIRYIDVTGDDASDWFLNINTEDDWRRALQMQHRERS